MKYLILLIIPSLAFANLTTTLKEFFNLQEPKVEVPNCDDPQAGDPKEDKDKKKLCKDSKSPMFADDSVLEMEVMANFDKINDHSLPDIEYKDRVQRDPIVAKAISPGFIKYELDGKTYYVGAQVQARGKSRFKNCMKMRPLKFVFEDPKEIDEFMASLPANLPESEKEKKLYEYMDKKPKEKKDKGKKVEGIFDKLGDKVKLTTHCHHRVFAGYLHSASDYDNYVLAEYNVFKLLELANPIAMKTRKVMITYKDKNGNVIDSRIAFIREPDSKTAKRCGMKSVDFKEDHHKNNEESWMRYEMLNNFLGNFDSKPDLEFKTKDGYKKFGHNVEFMQDDNGELHLVPYDFDGASIISQYHSDKQNITPKVSALSVISFLNSQENKVLAKKLAGELYKKTPAMLEQVKNSDMSDFYKERFTKWITANQSALKDYLKK